MIQKIKGKGHPVSCQWRNREEVGVYPYSCLMSALVGGGWSTPRHGRFTPREVAPLPIVKEDG